MKSRISLKTIVCLFVGVAVGSLFITYAPKLRILIGQKYRQKDLVSLRGAQVRAVHSTWTSGSKSETITVAFVVCGMQADLALVAIKSVIAYSTSPLHLIILADKESEVDMKKQVESWPSSIKKRVHAQLKPVPPPVNPDLALQECAAQQLYLPSLLPDVDALLYVSTEMVFVHPVEDIWRMFYSMTDQEMVGMAPEMESIDRNLYLSTSLQPFVEPFGVNSHLLLMNLTRMRANGFERSLNESARELKNVTISPVEDALNIFFARNPEGIFTFTCRWNYRPEHCYKSALCTDGPVAVVHGAYDDFMYRNPAFMALHNSMRQYKLGNSLLQGFIKPLKKNLAMRNWDGCHVEFVRHLEYWRLSADRVDRVSNRTSHLQGPAH
ncbi:glucoside xylosyltransferase 2 isoform X2 [Rhipicephalus microplus]